ncbi:hypothetical protein O9929_09875 [Vibrio lentus]|nr:hypothetical protein [Vibrio lentus]
MINKRFGRQLSNKLNLKSKKLRLKQDNLTEPGSSRDRQYATIDELIAPSGTRGRRD